MTLSASLSGDSNLPHPARSKLGDLATHQQYWRQSVGFALAALLNSAGYSPKTQINIIRHFSDLITPYLGISRFSSLPRWHSFMTDDRNPTELSWDFHTGLELPTIRYSVEPIGLDAGTVTNKWNEKTAARFQENPFAALSNPDTTLFHHFKSHFGHSWTDDAPEGHPSNSSWAFDLNPKSITTKAYFFTGAAAHVEQRPKMEIITNAIASAPPINEKNLAAFTVFSNYLTQRQDLNVEVDMLALDFVPINDSRLKIYFRDRRTTFDSVEENISLKGQVHDPTFDTSIGKLRRVWDLLFRSQNAPDSASLSHREHRTAGIIYNVEFRSERTVPKVKIYIPVRHYAENDGQIINTSRTYFAEELSANQMT